MPPHYTIEWGKNPENDVGNDVGLITFLPKLCHM